MFPMFFSVQPTRVREIYEDTARAQHQPPAGEVEQRDARHHAEILPEDDVGEYHEAGQGGSSGGARQDS